MTSTPPYCLNGYEGLAMQHRDAMNYATTIATLLLKGAKKVAGMPICDQSLFGTLSLSLALSKVSEGGVDDVIRSLDPAIHEIILFGSTARGKDMPGDVDLMVFDNGFYSNLVCFEPSENETRPFMYGSYGKLRENLVMMLCHYMGMDMDDITVRSAPVDLHVLPIALFHPDGQVRKKIAARHVDPMFFEKSLSCIKRFDAERREFIDCNLSYLEEKYGKADADIPRAMCSPFTD